MVSGFGQPPVPSIVPEGADNGPSCEPPDEESNSDRPLRAARSIYQVVCPPTSPSGVVWWCLPVAP